VHESSNLSVLPLANEFLKSTEGSQHAPPPSPVDEDLVLLDTRPPIRPYGTDVIGEPTCEAPLREN